MGAPLPAFSSQPGTQSSIPSCPGRAFCPPPAQGAACFSRTAELTPGHSGPRRPPKLSRHQVGSQQTGSLSGDECWDLPFYSRITTRKITQLPIFPPDDRFQCCTDWWLGYRGLRRTWEGGSKSTQLSNSAPCSAHNWPEVSKITFPKLNTDACSVRSGSSQRCGRHPGTFIFKFT